MDLGHPTNWTDKWKIKGLGAWCSKGSMDFDGFQWISMDFNGFQWISMDFHGFQWISMDFNGFQWISMETMPAGPGRTNKDPEN